MALIVGGGVVKYSRSRQAAALRKEAVIAGGLFGCLVGTVYLVQTLIVFGEDQAAQRFSVLSGLGLMAGGVVLCALLSLGMAALTLRRTTSES
jgi:multisubunit Na+/H+ antiporter MnhB subunit